MTTMRYDLCECYYLNPQKHRGCGVVFSRTLAHTGQHSSRTRCTFYVRVVAHANVNYALDSARQASATYALISHSDAVQAL